MSKTIRIGNEVESYLKKHGMYGETADDIIKRSLQKMYKVDIFTCLKKDNRIVEIYRRVVDLPFMPVIGMSFNQGTNTEIWEPIYFHGEGKLPVVERVYWNFDENMFVVRLSDIEIELESRFWEPCGSNEKLRYFSGYVENEDVSHFYN